jgi:hypothetical protein
VAVRRTAAQLDARRDALLSELERALTDAGVERADRRARWLVECIPELVELLAIPSRLCLRARELAARWPDAGPAPSYHIDGHAWIVSAGALAPAWTRRTETAWSHAWLLLSDVLAEQVASPFGDGCCDP